MNRTFTGLVSLAVILAVLGSFLRDPRRRDLTWLSFGLVVGVLAQIVLGGLTVIYGLSPPWVMAHFLLSMVLIADAVVLHVRAATSRRKIAGIGRASGAGHGMGRGRTHGVVLVTGTIVTGAGPHGGDENVRRLDVSVTTVARVHGVAENVLLAAVLATLWLVVRTHAPPSVRRDADILLVVLDRASRRGLRAVLLRRTRRTRRDPHPRRSVRVGRRTPVRASACNESTTRVAPAHAVAPEPVLSGT